LDTTGSSVGGVADDDGRGVDACLGRAGEAGCVGDDGDAAGKGAAGKGAAGKGAGAPLRPNTRRSMRPLELQPDGSFGDVRAELGCA